MVTGQSPENCTSFNYKILQFSGLLSGPESGRTMWGTVKTSFKSLFKLRVGLRCNKVARSYFSFLIGDCEEPIEDPLTVDLCNMFRDLFNKINQHFTAAKFHNYTL